MKFDKIAIIVGRGILPKLIIEELEKNNKEFIIFKLNSEIYDIDYSKYHNYSISYGEVAKFLEILKDHNINDVVFAGAVSKPNFSNLKIDNVGKILLSKILANKILGDDAVLKSVIKFFESKNINIIPVDQIIDCQISKKGDLTTIKPSQEDLKNIKIGVKAIKKFSEFDVGQSVIVAQKQIISVEGLEGTDNMINNLQKIKEDYKNGAILVKLKKKKQSRKADLPTIGINTIINCANSKIKGIAIEARSNLVLQKDEVIRKANELNIFITVL